MADDKFMALLDGHAVDIHLADGKRYQICVGDLVGIDTITFSIHTHTGIIIPIDEINYFEIKQ